MARERLRDREQRRQRARVEVPRGVTRAQRSVRQLIAQLSEPERRAVEQALQRLERARDRETQALRDELQLYRTLATVGTTTAVFAHESGKPATHIEKMAESIERRGRRELGDQYQQALDRPVQSVLRWARRLRSFAELPLRLLQHEKRRSGRVDIHHVIEDVVGSFEPFLAERKVATSLQLFDGEPILRGSAAAVEGILTNLITNAVNAFAQDDRPSPKPRSIMIRTELSGTRLLLHVLDNGPGISGLKVSDVWLPGRTTMPGGTGLGLTIVRDTVGDLGGEVHAVAQGEIGGAEFIIELPVIGVAK
jgi:C4-dicarboxylate-specific signal transduction histidine kinase